MRRCLGFACLDFDDPTFIGNVDCLRYLKYYANVEDNNTLPSSLPAPSIYGSGYSECSPAILSIFELVHQHI